jgi:HSP20 family molecular chaperone IbpA
MTGGTKMAENTIATQGAEPEAPARQEPTRAQEQYVAPPVDIYEETDHLVLVADMPGVAKEGLTVQVKNGVLSIEGHVTERLAGTSLYREFDLVSFFREFRISDVFDTDRIRAELKHGVLRLTLPKPEQQKPRQIPVQVT